MMNASAAGTSIGGGGGLETIVDGEIRSTLGGRLPAGTGIGSRGRGPDSPWREFPRGGLHALRARQGNVLVVHRRLALEAVAEGEVQPTVEVAGDAVALEKRAVIPHELFGRPVAPRGHLTGHNTT